MAWLKQNKNDWSLYVKNGILYTIFFIIIDISMVN